jgi:hypothetical protein
MCPVDKKWHNENMFMRDLAHAKLHAFDATHGFFMWNWKTELEVTVTCETVTFETAVTVALALADTL